MNVLTIRPIAVWSSSICSVFIRLWFEALWRRFRELTVDLIALIHYAAIQFFEDIVIVSFQQFDLVHHLLNLQVFILNGLLIHSYI